MASLLLIATVAAGGFLLLGKEDEAQLTPADQETRAVLEQVRGRLSPRVWSQIEAQPWFADGKITEDGLRFVRFIADYYNDLGSTRSVQLFSMYPTGLSEDNLQLLTSLKSSSALRLLLFEPWFADGVDANERAFIGYLATATETNWTFDEFLVTATTKPWFRDGIDDREIAVVGAGSALSPRNRPKAEELINGLEGDLFLYEKALLPVSGEKDLLVSTTSKDLEARLRPALDLVKQWMSQVESFAGPYLPRFIVVSVADLSARPVCGTGSGQDEETPGVITLHLNCVQDRTVIHELAHIFVGTGPTWFTEGFADLIVYHITGRMGGYHGRASTGKIEIGFRRGPGGVGSPEYGNQGSLGAKYLFEVYRLIGPAAMSAALQQMMTVEWPRDGRVLLDVLTANTREDLRPRLASLTAERFE